MADWGRFEPMTDPARRPGATVEYRFRNGTEVEFVAQPIRVEKLLDDVKAYIKTRPPQLDWQKINIADLGYRLVNENQAQYVGEQVARGSSRWNPARTIWTSASRSPRPCRKPGRTCLPPRWPAATRA